MAEEIGSRQISNEQIPTTEETQIHQLGALPKKPEVDVDNARKVSTDSCALNHVPGFPHFVRNIRHFVAHQSYVRSLFAAGHGYPMYDTGTVSEVPEDYTNIRGISIGDVGVLSNHGEFVFAFNLFLPPDHPYNKGNTPASFSPLEPLEESEIQTVDEYFPRGAVVTSKGIKVTRHSESPLRLSFHSSERIGGLLVLPEGATRQDASTDRIHKYVARHAHDWAYFFSQRRWDPSTNGSTYVVTGVDKTSNCSTMAFQVRLSTSPRIRATYGKKALVAPDGISAVRNTIKPKVTTPPSRNLCVFLRGIRIGVGRAEWIENVDERPDNVEYATLYTELYFPPPWITVFKARIALRLGFGRIGERPGFSYFVHPFHLSDIIGPMMLSLRPDAPLVLIDDLVESIDSNQNASTKGPLERRPPLTFSCSKGASFRDFRMMVTELFDHYDVVEHDGILRLKRNSKESIAKVSWRTDIRHLFTPMYNRNWASRAFTELVRKGQHHMDTNAHLPKHRTQ
ncbi:hypothetical protein M413DRAFT_448527 [Hebeloma cylindrosporum]|uniref:Uncharacterized protein n=1 Tax=Hebeloma cylindrosporum TaxID=76867 RepID=A0A0C2Y8X3_HEBCY|nr:hypothetical protein M413DRAFT_448527 [Hebeloma cylindrosporum h7]